MHSEAADLFHITEGTRHETRALLGARPRPRGPRPGGVGDVAGERRGRARGPCGVRLRRPRWPGGVSGHPAIDWRAIEGAPDDVGPFSGRDAMRRYYGEWLEMFDDARNEAEEFIEAGNQVVVLQHASGRSKRIWDGSGHALRGRLHRAGRQDRRGREYATARRSPQSRRAGGLADVAGERGASPRGLSGQSTLMKCPLSCSLQDFVWCPATMGTVEAHLSRTRGLRSTTGASPTPGMRCAIWCGKPVISDEQSARPWPYAGAGRGSGVPVETR